MIYVCNIYILICLLVYPFRSLKKHVDIIDIEDVSP